MTTVECSIKSYKSPPPCPRDEYRRIWVNFPTPHWEYRRFHHTIVPLPNNREMPDSNIGLLEWQFDNPGRQENEDYVGMVISYILQEDLNIPLTEEDEENMLVQWDREHETWIPTNYSEEYLNFLRQGPTSIQQQINKQQRDYSLFQQGS